MMNTQYLTVWARRTAAIACTAVCFFGAAQSAAAVDCIQPSPDVVNGVTLRAAPNSSSASVGMLRSGESLPLIAFVPNWYATQLATGQPAFASKRWTDIVQCAPVATTIEPVFELHAVDVGTGLAIVVRGPDFNLLEDAGSNDDLALGIRNRTVAYLHTLTPAVTKLNHVILTHPHRDHVEMLPDVLTNFEIENVWNSGAFNDICGYRRFLEAIAAKPSILYHTATQDGGYESVTLGTKNCYGTAEPAKTLLLSHSGRIDDQTISLGQNASMKILYANGTTKSSLNENSLVVRLDLGSHRILFMGDAEAGGRKAPSTAPSANSIEGLLLACCINELKADVLIVGHHGSKTSSRTAFLDAVGAKLFVISSGPTKYSTVTLPDPEIVEELKSRGDVYRTNVDDDECKLSQAKVGPDLDGKAGGCDNILITLPANGAIAASYRQLAD